MLLMLWSPFKDESSKEILSIIEIGINHEEQHQELLAYDIKYILGNQPTFPSYENSFKTKVETQALYQN
jgi:hypothetical protein